MAAEGKGKRKISPRGFYSRALDEAEKLELEEASHVEGIDEEIALLRVKLRELLEEQPERSNPKSPDRSCCAIRGWYRN
jgi:hypothetical protein